MNCKCIVSKLHYPIHDTAVFLHFISKAISNFNNVYSSPTSIHYFMIMGVTAAVAHTSIGYGVWSSGVFAGNFLVFSSKFIIHNCTCQSFVYIWIFHVSIHIFTVNMNKKASFKCFGKSGVCRGNPVCSASGVHYYWWLK